MTGDFNIKIEDKLLIGLCRPGFSHEETERIEILISSVRDWRYFADRANAHGVGALVYHNLSELGLIQHLPEQVREFLRNVMILNLARNTQLINETGEILHLLNGYGIKTVLLKGMALELTVYGNKGLRQMTDVDVLLTKNGCIKAQKLLMTGGFRSLPVKSPFHKPIILYTGKHIPSMIKGDFSVDIHHNLFGERNSELSRMIYDNSYETDINGEKAFIPPSQLFLLYLVKHLNYHEMNNESQLRLYTDLVFLIEAYREEILNDDLIRLAHQAGIQEIIAEKLALLGDFWGISYPDWIDKFIVEHYMITGLPEKFIYFLGSPKGNPVVNKASQYKNAVREIPGFHRKILFVVGDIFPSIGFMKKRYSCGIWKALLYYPHRFGKLWYLIKPTPPATKNKFT
jgi:hypothetical protein